MRKIHRWGLRSIVAVLVVSLFPLMQICAEGGGSIEESQKRKATELSQQVLSPFCPGRALTDCPSSKANELKAEILAKVKAGLPDEQILEGVFQRFGDQYRAIPKREGFGRLVWLVPGLFVAIGLAFAYGFTRKRVAQTGLESTPSVLPLSSDAQAELERELDGFAQ